LPNEPEVISLDPQYVSDVLEDIKRIGIATHSEDAAKLITDQMQARIDNVVNRLAGVVNKPKVLHLEWVDPLMCGGHWVPEMIELAGGINCFGDKETGSFPLEWESIIDSQPEVVVLMPCGFDVKRGLQDLPLLSDKDGWASLPAVKNNRVYVIDAGAYTSRSGPRLVDGLEILAEMIHPDLFSGMIPESGALRIYGDLINAT
jgi:iron complex transport system substrate-binding protein